MPIERNETGVGELRRGAQLAGAERGRRASNAAKVGFDRIEAFGQRHGSREARALEAEAGLSGNPARILELVGDEAGVPALRRRDIEFARRWVSGRVPGQEACPRVRILLPPAASLVRT